ncbi:AAA family ATPase [Rivibacter subsaxonicus]|uniref:Bifunctional DNA primase/polymerase-like protein n=1 Tax=Rivibacter subsaxonicus TaxID=457575 RepID=A0A4Q7VGX2_9BURK|nr:AAA family ATPase [Rivibacter subsaxonicus]RZT95301.1 bifunctional DNA primase/polymerase-like protein [Rivibacter subsaxonicus]
MSQRPALVNPRKKIALEARRQGFKVVELQPLSKRPSGQEWNTRFLTAAQIRNAPEDANFGIHLSGSGLCSVDFDDVERFKAGLKALGIASTDWERGIWTSSTRPGSGGKFLFRLPAGVILKWLRFRTTEHGTLGELRAGSPNLQDCLGGTKYLSADGLTEYKQKLEGSFEDLQELDGKLLEVWLRASEDIGYRHEIEQTMAKAVGGTVSASMGQDGEKLAFPSSRRMEFNRDHEVEDLLREHNYVEDEGTGRWSHPLATGMPGISRIPGKDDLWVSHHAGDPLSGVFDAWAAHVVLDHDGDVRAAERAYSATKGRTRAADAAEAFGGSEAGSRAAEGQKDDGVLVRGDSVPMTATEWLWPGWLAKGAVHLLAGEGGVGKSTTGMSLLATVSVGGCFPDGHRAKMGKVVVWTGEDSIGATLLPRFVSMGGDPSMIYFVVGETKELGPGEVRLFDPAFDMPKLEQAITRLGGVQMLMIDPLISAIDGDSHKAGDVRRGLQPVVDLTERCKLVTLGLTHFAKGTERKPVLDRVLASQAFTAISRIVLVAAELFATEDERRFVLSRAKNNLGPSGGGFEYVIEPDAFVSNEGEFIHTSKTIWGTARVGSARDLIAPPTTEDRKVVQAKQFLVNRLADGPVDSAEVQNDASASGITLSALKKAKAELAVENRKLGLGGNAVWFLPEHEAQVDSPLTRAQEFLFEHLERAPRLAKEMETAAKAAGTSARTLARAKAALGIETFRKVHRGQFWWRLPLL